jgi:hypothetical protein
MREHHASLVTAEGKVWFINDNGSTHTVKPGEKYEELAASELGQKVFASPALSNGQIFVRGYQSLFCFGEKKGLAAR